MIEKPFAPACERNKDAILSVLKEIIDESNRKLFEIGSGTGQHAAYFAKHFPHLEWVTSDVAENHLGISLWLAEAKLANLRGPYLFDVDRTDISKNVYDLVFAANILHILSWKQDKTLFKKLGRGLSDGAQVLFYGPFNYAGNFTSASNQAFDEQLKQNDPKRGIRNFEEVVSNMRKNGFELTQDFEMPANNRLLQFLKLSGAVSSSG